MQKIWVQFLIREDPTCRRATKFVCHSCWARAPEPWPQLLSPCATTTEACMAWSPCSATEKPLQWEAWAPKWQSGPCSLQLEESLGSSEDPEQLKVKKKKKKRKCKKHWDHKEKDKVVMAGVAESLVKRKERRKLHFRMWFSSKQNMSICLTSHAEDPRRFFFLFLFSFFAIQFYHFSLIKY